MWNIPNILTILRLIFAMVLPLFFILLPRPLADWVAVSVFVGVALTDYLDGYLARAWKITTKFGTMLDPIADKAMVLSALLAVVAFTGLDTFVIIPATLIVFREVFVSGLREYLGADATKLAVTKLAKWKTAVQMSAIATLLSIGVIDDLFSKPLVETGSNLFALNVGSFISFLGIALLWGAGILTAITGFDYLRKAWPYLQD